MLVVSLITIDTFHGRGPHLQDVHNANRKGTKEQVVYYTITGYMDHIMMQRDPEQQPGYLRGWRCVRRPYL